MILIITRVSTLRNEVAELLFRLVRHLLALVLRLLLEDLERRWTYEALSELCLDRLVPLVDGLDEQEQGLVPFIELWPGEVATLAWFN